MTEDNLTKKLIADCVELLIYQNGRSHFYTHSLSVLLYVFRFALDRESADRGGGEWQIHSRALNNVDRPNRMAKVAAPGSLSSDSFHLRGGAVTAGPLLKRKTPSELRGEQLRRGTAVELVDQSPAFLQNTKMVDFGPNKGDHPSNTRYIETRLDEVYPVKKPSSRLRLLSGKAIAKENMSVDDSFRIKNSSFPQNLAPKRHQELNCCDNLAASAGKAQESAAQEGETTEKCHENRFRSVAELSLGSNLFSESTVVDMDKALKGLAAREPCISGLSADSSRKCGDSKSIFLGNTCSELYVPGRNVPLDFTLKTAIRIVSSSSINWFHRLLMSSTYTGMTPPSSQCSCMDKENIACVSKASLTIEEYGPNMSHSWIYPQSSLPTSVISALSSATMGVEMDFLSKRQLSWEESFRNLYYMLRKNACDIFFVCTSQFVVLFIALGGNETTKRKCNAYVSQSTRALRSTFREHDLCFSMPLCSSEVEQISREDLVELSEIEKHNLGQTKHLSSISDVDNGPQSLLAFNGNESSHGLYDFLLNYKSFLISFTGVDVPLLCSPVPFKNAALSAPEIRCKEIKLADHLALQSEVSTKKDSESVARSSGGICYSIEVKGSYLPPWIICSICAAMGCEERSFEASFTAEPSSLGLNVALDVIDRKYDPQEPTEEKSQGTCRLLGMAAAAVSELRCASMKRLKYCNGSYTASLFHI
ncbi:hypothetical protein Nepgr_031843 [Nepenthes gracilis]|uniref:Protein downstream neighbor of Son n=1 Tax=Nepenthes gracilis TaxID=150966 RepID=A0AAD3Y773_NEPGR|nr:hypothetical protein Nepgr_031843 [Nepenthes gracilis]